MEKSTSIRLVLLGAVVMVVGVTVWIGGGKEGIDVHPIHLFDIVPGYTIVAVGALIVVIAVVLGFVKNKSAQTKS